LVRKHWPVSHPAASDEYRKEIARIAAVLQAGVGRPKPGQAIFKEQCSKCHKLFGQGGDVGPDLTTFNRIDIDAILLSVVHPSAEIRDGYNAWLLITNDGRVLTGTLADQDPQTVRLRTPDGISVTVPRSDVDEMTISKSSIMPEGLLKSYSDEQLRDLFAYLRMTQPLIDR
jgi:putative heme-binding domain-containing protein